MFITIVLRNAQNVSKESENKDQVQCFDISFYCKMMLGIMFDFNSAWIDFLSVHYEDLIRYSHIALQNSEPRTLGHRFFCAL